MPEKVKPVVVDYAEGNKLIVEYLKWGKCQRCVEDCGNFKSGQVYFSLQEMKFHSSSDWIMRVVEKISKEYTVNINSFPGQGFDVRIKEGNLIRGYGEHENNSEATYAAVVNFLKWLNQNQK